jgi:hypothetical protein
VLGIRKGSRPGLFVAGGLGAISRGAACLAGPLGTSATRERDVCNEIEGPQSAPEIRSVRRWPRFGTQAERAPGGMLTWAGCKETDNG